jgi:hypothetical protein
MLLHYFNDGILGCYTRPGSEGTRLTGLIPDKHLVRSIA